jgi:hypothetical protein
MYTDHFSPSADGKGVAEGLGITFASLPPDFIEIDYKFRLFSSVLVQ